MARDASTMNSRAIFSMTNFVRDIFWRSPLVEDLTAAPSYEATSEMKRNTVDESDDDEDEDETSGEVEDEEFEKRDPLRVPPGGKRYALRVPPGGKRDALRVPPGGKRDALRVPPGGKRDALMVPGGER
jgi:hypothetical protein